VGEGIARRHQDVGVREGAGVDQRGVEGSEEAEIAKQPLPLREEGPGALLEPHPSGDRAAPEDRPEGRFRKDLGDRSDDPLGSSVDLGEVVSDDGADVPSHRVLHRISLIAALAPAGATPLDLE